MFLILFLFMSRKQFNKLVLNIYILNFKIRRTIVGETETASKNKSKTKESIFKFELKVYLPYLHAHRWFGITVVCMVHTRTLSYNIPLWFYMLHR